MGIYQLLRERGFIESPLGPLVLSELSDIVERFEVSGIPFAILPGHLVPEARAKDYSKEVFETNYILFRLEPLQ